MDAVTNPYRLGPRARSAIIQRRLALVGEAATEADVNADLARQGQGPMDRKTFRLNYQRVFGRPPPDGQCSHRCLRDGHFTKALGDLGRPDAADRLVVPDGGPALGPLDASTLPQDLLRVAQLPRVEAEDWLTEFLKFGVAVVDVGGTARARAYLDVIDRIEGIRKGGGGG